MNMLLLAVILAFTATNAKAEWTRIGENGSGTFTLYVDLTTARKASDKIKMWNLIDYKTAQILDGDKVSSFKTQFEYDCKEEQYRLLATSWFSENLGGGRVVSYDSNPGKWEPIQPESTSQTLWVMACERNQ